MVGATIDCLESHYQELFENAIENQKKQGLEMVEAVNKLKKTLDAMIKKNNKVLDNNNKLKNQVRGIEYQVNHWIREEGGTGWIRGVKKRKFKELEKLYPLSEDDSDSEMKNDVVKELKKNPGKNAVEEVEEEIRREKNEMLKRKKKDEVVEEVEEKMNQEVTVEGNSESATKEDN